MSENREHRNRLINYFVSQVEWWDLENLIGYAQDAMREKLHKVSLKDLINDYENYAECHVSELIPELGPDPDLEE